jgi:hypothetical protein
MEPKENHPPRHRRVLGGTVDGLGRKGILLNTEGLLSIVPWSHVVFTAFIGERPDERCGRKDQVGGDPHIARYRYPKGVQVATVAVAR